ncbi:LytTR family transcriptional regulator DNA-binding domain-containing protein [Aureibaculum sp. 2210JD6-5]|uniref:LytTR family transcriptional regulator DNA-binding domain-containing protein n=1 Tax=Aureibaculum sp. 2210JD6-5 TaxID=3103957 RepID=UPI0039F1BCF2
MKNKDIIILDSLRNWEEKLKKYNFIRTHRSFIVNLDKAEKVTDNQIHISNQIIPIGVTYKSKFFETMR